MSGVCINLGKYQVCRILVFPRCLHLEKKQRTSRMENCGPHIHADTCRQPPCPPSFRRLPLAEHSILGEVRCHNSLLSLQIYHDSFETHNAEQGTGSYLEIFLRGVTQILVVGKSWNVQWIYKVKCLKPFFWQGFSEIYPLGLSHNLQRNNSKHLNNFMKREEFWRHLMEQVTVVSPEFFEEKF